MKTHYYSPKLKLALETLDQARTVLIEAPSGYGKTTAVITIMETLICVILIVPFAGIRWGRCMTNIRNTCAPGQDHNRGKEIP